MGSRVWAAASSNRHGSASCEAGLCRGHLPALPRAVQIAGCWAVGTLAASPRVKHSLSSGDKMKCCLESMVQAILCMLSRANRPVLQCAEPSTPQRRYLLQCTCNSKRRPTLSPEALGICSALGEHAHRFARVQESSEDSSDLPKSAVIYQSDLPDRALT